jgi:probable phosphoglycerate mutase
MKNKLIYLIRHGETLTNNPQKKRYIGQLDIPLSNKGIGQAQRLAEVLGRLPIVKVYASNLTRSLQTAEFIAASLCLKPEIISNLAEINLGRWEGLLFEEVRCRYPEEYIRRGQNILHHRPPGGESFAECRQRVLAAYHQIATEVAGPILVVAHAGVNRLILCDILGMQPENLFMIEQNYGCLNMIRRTNSGDRIILINDVLL